MLSLHPKKKEEKKKKFTVEEAIILRTEKRVESLGQAVVKVGNPAGSMKQQAIRFSDSEDSSQEELRIKSRKQIGKICFEDSEDSSEEDTIASGGVTWSMVEPNCPNRFLTLELREITVFVDLEGSLSIVKIPVGSVVGVIKGALIKKGVPMALDMKLHFGGKILSDSLEIWKTGAGEGSTIFSMLPIRGGSKRTGAANSTEKKEFQRRRIRIHVVR